ncbi:hypothetical protein ABE137_12050 [Brevibacillus laterosporus]|uniref:hypothetical protein n=1 Tax=Brevibacillus phage Sundance TaxID=1691958 RepID=UPI0006BC7C92|nr:hypothetical protein AVT09_gp079 [Brevibacillus phage Sundance]ALA47895.1 hypothetical protein SUNDANCE_79 [Brevibacillus phage Sundance]
MKNRKVLIIELKSNEEIDIHKVVSNIDNAILNGEDDGVEEWFITEAGKEDKLRLSISM